MNDLRKEIGERDTLIKKFVMNTGSTNGPSLASKCMVTAFKSKIRELNRKNDKLEKRAEKGKKSAV